MNDQTYTAQWRTWSSDAVVGHGDSPAHPSHFIVQNYKGELLIIELPGGSVKNSVTYGGFALGTANLKTPVTLTFKDVTGDLKPDMIIHAGSNTFVLVNTGTGFRQAQPGEIKLQP